MSGTKISWPSWLPQVLWKKCPSCGSEEFKPAELRSLDGLLGLFALRPVRCKFCWRRFYWITLRGEYREKLVKA
jgi:hypothetical protein